MGIVTRLNPMGGTLKFYFFQINPTPIQSNVVINGAETRRVIEKSGTVINWRVSLSAHSAQEGVIILTENTILNVELPQTQYQKLKIIPEPADSLVLINNVEQREIIVEFGTELVWSVSRNGYLPQNGSIELIDDVILDIKLEKEKYLFSINATPQDAEIYINDILQSSALIAFEETAKYIVKKYGYATQTGNIVITKETTIDIVLEEVPFYDFTIAATPENAVIVINSIETNSVSLEQNAVVEWSVSLLGYIEQKGILNLKEDTVLNITLEKKKFIFQITTIPDDCTIKINNQEFSSIIVDYETTVNWIVERNGYVSKSGENIVTEDTALSIELEKENYTYCIVPEPSDSTVFINGIEQTSIIVPYKTSVSYSVSRVGYEAQTGMYQVLGNFSHNIILQKKNYTFEITSNVEGATIYVNGELAVFPMVAEYGTVMNWSVTADGYTTQSDSTVLTDNIKLNITLVKKIFKVIIQPIPAASTIVIDGVETNYIEAPFMTEFQYSVSREGYATKTGAYTIINDWTLSVELDVLQYTLTINPTPENAIVTINDTVQNSITVDYGTIVNWSVSATGYETEYGAQKVTEDTVLDILMRLAYFTVTFSPTPSDATVLINDIIQNSIRAIYGTVFNWSVSAPYYISQSGSEKIEKTYTKEVILQENVSSVSLSGCTLTCSPASSKTINGSSITWVTGTSAVSASSVSASISKSSGIVSGPCKIKMVCSYLYGPNFSNWKYTLTYTIKTGNKSKSTEVNGLSATVILSEEQKLTKFTMSVGGNSNKINANTRAGCSFSLYKYI